MEEKLKSLKLKRHSKVGKKISKQVWAHVDYISELVPEKLLKVVFNSYQFRNLDFKATVFRFDSKKNEICFFECNDFDTANEPTIGESFSFKSLKSFNHKKRETKNPLIYHHKWMFVKDDYQGFDVEESKRRSIEWKEILGVNKEVSNKIGRIVFWKQWLIENGLKL